MNLQTSLRSAVSALEVGQTLAIRLGDYGYGTIRGYAFELGVSLDRDYKTHLDRGAHRYTITRTR